MNWQTLPVLFSGKVKGHGIALIGRNHPEIIFRDVADLSNYQVWSNQRFEVA